MLKTTIIVHLFNCKSHGDLCPLVIYIGGGDIQSLVLVMSNQRYRGRQRRSSLRDIVITEKQASKNMK